MSHDWKLEGTGACRYLRREWRLVQGKKGIKVVSVVQKGNSAHGKRALQVSEVETHCGHSAHTLGACSRALRRYEFRVQKSFWKLCRGLFAAP